MDDSDDESDIDDECDEKKTDSNNNFFARIFQNTKRNNGKEDYEYKLDIYRKLKLNQKKGNIKHFEFFEMDRNPNVYLSVLERYLNKKLCDLKAYKRYILLIDRRKGNDRINVYFYEAPKDCNKISRLHHEYLRYNQLWNSHKCILPKDPTLPICDKPKDIGLYDTENGYMFGLSYHINNRNSISSYWASHGSALRFLPNDMIRIWPYYFVNNDVIENTNFKLYGFEDKPFEEFYAISTGKKDIYSVNSCKHSREKPILPGHNHEDDGDDESGSDEEKEYKVNERNDGENNGKDLIIEKIMTLDKIWSKCVCLAIINIDDRFNCDDCDVTDIIDDINEGIEESELLFYLIKNGISEWNAFQFGQQVIYLLGEGH